MPLLVSAPVMVDAPLVSSIPPTLLVNALAMVPLVNTTRPVLTKDVPAKVRPGPTFTVVNEVLVIAPNPV